MAKPQSDLTPLEAQARIRQLRSQIEEYNRLYYEEATSAISDPEFDRLLRELADLETEFPDLKTESSPTRKVGGKPLEGFTQVEHLAPMLSLENTYSETEAVEFYQRMQKLLPGEAIPVVVEPKVDGVAITLVYKNGDLAYAATRGDGRVGDDVTRNILTLESVPTRLKNAPELIEIRGEVYLPRDVFLELNTEQERLGKPLFANPRNTAAGSLKQLDPELARKRRLEIMLYGTGAVNGMELESHSDALAKIASWGLPVSQWKRTAESPESMLAAVRELDTVRKSFPYETDGAVIKVDDFAQRERLGFTSKAPRWAMAFKYAAERAETRLLDIQVQVGRTGTLTPVAHLEPVVVSGSRVARATLHNEEEIARKDIRIGDLVVIEKAGEVIPAVVEVNLDARPRYSQPFNLREKIGSKCPSCGGPIGREEGFVAWRCFGFECPAQTATKLAHFAGRKMLNIDGIGETVANKLVENRLVKSPLDLFSLDQATIAKLNLGTDDQPRVFGPRNAAKLIAALEQSKKLPLSKWIFAIGVPQVGESAAREVSRLIETFNQVPSAAILEQISERGEKTTWLKDNPIKPKNGKLTGDETERRKRLAQSYTPRVKALNSNLTRFQISPELGGVAAANLLKFFGSESGQKMLQTLSDLGINPKSNNFAPEPKRDPKAGDLFAGKGFVITGTLSRPREDFEKMIQAAGGLTKSSVSPKTHYVIAGEDAGTKLKKALELGITILKESDFFSMMSDRVQPSKQEELFPE